MFRLIRRGITAALAMAAPMIPEAPPDGFGQGADPVRCRAGRSVQEAGPAAPGGAEYEQALDLARQYLSPEDVATAAVMNSLADCIGPWAGTPRPSRSTGAAWRSGEAAGA